MVATPYGKDAVAKIIRQQIGFWAWAEVGARNPMYSATSLYFDAKPESRIVRVVVTLDPSDTYTVSVANKKTGKVLYQESDIYNDMLADIIMNLAREIRDYKEKK